MGEFFSVCLNTGPCTALNRGVHTHFSVCHVLYMGCSAWDPSPLVGLRPPPESLEPLTEVWPRPVELGVMCPLYVGQSLPRAHLAGIPSLSPLVLRPAPHVPLHRDGYGESLVLPGLHTQHLESGQGKISQGGLRKWMSAVRTSRG